MRVFLVLTFVFIQVQVALGQSLEEARLSFDNKEYKQAEQLFAAVHAEKKDAESAYYLGRIALEKNEHADAIKWMEKAVDKETDNAEYHYWLSESYFRRIGEVGMLKKGGLAKKGKRAAERAVEIDPSHKNARTSLVYFYVEAPSIAGGSVEKAYKQAELLKDHHPCRGQMMTAMVHEREEAFGAADAEYQAVVENCKDEENALYRAGLYFQGREQYNKAFDAFNLVTEHDPEAINAFYQVGRTAVLAEERLEEGEEAFKHVLKLAEDDDLSTRASAWWRLGMLYELSGDTNKATEAYKQSLAIKPDFDRAKQALSAMSG